MPQTRRYKKFGGGWAGFAEPGKVPETIEALKPAMLDWFRPRFPGWTILMV